MQADLRFEKKFVLQGISPLLCERVILGHNLFFREIYHPRFVNNIYFDDHCHNAYYQSADGLSHRSKYRIRFYGDLNAPIKKPVLEIKTKFGQLGKKQAFDLIPFSIHELGPQINCFEQLFLDSKIPEDIRLNLAQQHPVLINRYQRKYFQSASHPVRATIDWDLQYFSFQNYPTVGQNENNVVLEFKYPQQHEYIANRLSQELPFVASKNSKFVIGSTLINEIF